MTKKIDLSSPYDSNSDEGIAAEGIAAFVDACFESISKFGISEEAVEPLICEPLSESERQSFDINQLNLNEINSIQQEFYTIEETKKHLRKKFPDEKFENGDIANLVAENKLDLRVTFADEMLLSRAWITDKKKNFQGDLGIEYKRFHTLEDDDVVILTNPLLSFELVYSTTIGQSVIVDIIKHIGSNYLTEKPFTKYGILLHRGDKYWKVVRTPDWDVIRLANSVLNDCVYADEVSQECFVDKATWGISAESLERYCNPIKWSNLTADEKQECAIQAYQEAEAKNISLEVIAKRLGTTRQTLYEWANKLNKPRAPLEQIVQSLKKSK